MHTNIFAHMTNLFYFEYFFLQGGDEFKHKLELRLIKADQQDAQFQHYFQVEIYVM